jgi:hypothetical protein
MGNYSKIISGRDITYKADEGYIVAIKGMSGGSYLIVPLSFSGEIECITLAENAQRIEREEREREEREREERERENNMRNEQKS